jgi:hypothetical protein
MINTYSKFYYGLTITGENKYLDFNEGSGELSAEIQPGTYTPEDLAIAVEEALNLVGLYDYVVSFDRTTRLLTITSSSAVSWLAATGTHVVEGLSAFETLGYPASDISSVTSLVASNELGSEYSPQYLLQQYVDEKDSRRNRFASVTVSASGKVQMQSFGQDRFFEFSINYCTDYAQPIGSPILNNPNGVSDVRAFMQWLKDKNTIEFMPDKDDVASYYRVVLESSPGSNDGSGYKLLENFADGLLGYFDTGLLTFRIIED